MATPSDEKSRAPQFNIATTPNIGLIWFDKSSKQVHFQKPLENGQKHMGNHTTNQNSRLLVGFRSWVQRLFCRSPCVTILPYFIHVGQTYWGAAPLNFSGQHLRAIFPPVIVKCISDCNIYLLCTVWQTSWVFKHPLPLKKDTIFYGELLCCHAHTVPWKLMTLMKPHPGLRACLTSFEVVLNNWLITVHDGKQRDMSCCH